MAQIFIGLCLAAVGAVMLYNQIWMDAGLIPLVAGIILAAANPINSELQSDDEHPIEAHNAAVIEAAQEAVAEYKRGECSEDELAVYLCELRGMIM